MTILLSPELRDIKNQKDSELSPAHSKACEVTEPILILVMSSLQQGTESFVLCLPNLKSGPRLLYFHVHISVHTQVCSKTPACE